MLIRLEKVSKDEVGILVDGRPKGTWKLPSLKYTEHSSEILFLLGNLLPLQQRSREYKNNLQLDKVVPFSGCLSELSVNGHSVALKELNNKKDTIAINLNNCQSKYDVDEYELEEQSREELVTTTKIPPTFIPIVVTDVTKDPLLEEKNVESREKNVLNDEEDKNEFVVEDSSVEPSYPGLMLDTIAPDPLPVIVEEPQTIGTIYNTVQQDNEELQSTPTVISEYSDELEETTLMPAPSILLLSSNGETSTDKTSTDKMSVDEIPTYKMANIETSTDKMPTSYPTQRNPILTVEHQHQQIHEVLEQRIFLGLCNQKTCGIHGNCEEINSTHVMCHCRDFWGGQFCEEFQPLEYAAGFDGSAFVVFSSEEFPHMISDFKEIIQFKLRTKARYGLIFWQGQYPSTDEKQVTEQFGEDFISIGLLGGHLSFTYELGGGAAQLVSEKQINDGRTHLIRATRQGRNGTLQIDNGKIIYGRSSGILAMLNVEGNIFVGGVPDLNIMTAGMFNQNFIGCLGEIELNEHKIDLMANAIDGRNVRPCNSWKSRQGRKKRRLLRILRRKN